MVGTSVSKIAKCDLKGGWRSAIRITIKIDPEAEAEQEDDEEED